MPWCPVCKNEYRDGFTTCSECKVPLVDSLDDIVDESEVIVGNDPSGDYDINTVIDTESYDTDLSNDEYDPPITEEEIYEKIVYAKKVASYQTKKAKYEDVKSSAVVFLGVGGAGTIVGILRIIEAVSNNKSLFSSIAGLVLFVAFLVYGLYAMKKANSLKDEAAKEEAKVDEIKKWLSSNLDKATITAVDSSDSIEENYFSRIALIKTKITTDNSIDVTEIDEIYLDQLIDEYYNELFGEN